MWWSTFQIEFSVYIEPEDLKKKWFWKPNSFLFQCQYLLNKLFQIFKISSLIFAFHQLLYWMAVWFYRLFHNPFFSFSFSNFLFVFGFSCIQFLTTPKLYFSTISLLQLKSTGLPTHTQHNNWNKKMQNL